MEDKGTLHVVMLPWLAMGHILPFFELSRRLARKGHRISFLTTRNNVQRLLPNIAPDLSRLLHLVVLPLPRVDNLPESVENTVDLTSDDHRQYLRIAYDTFEHQLSDFLRRGEDQPPDWIIYDYAAHWAPDVAAGHGIPCAYLSLFNAAVLSFFGPMSVEKPNRTAPEHFTTVPEWIPFPTTIAYRPYEARVLFKPGVLPDASGTSESNRFARGINACPFVAIRSCREFEGDWLELLGKLYGKLVVPVGCFPPPALPAEVRREEEGRKEWASAYEWLDKQETGSVVYAAFGSEAKLTSAQVDEIALGLELCGLHFVWVLRGESPPLPEGFEGRTAGRGVVCRDWVPQVRFLAHRSVGGFLTHGGWNSIVEGLSFGAVMVLLPLVFDQGLNARNLVDKGVGVEVARDEEDGSFTGEGVAKCLRLVMVEEEGAGFRAKARECKEIIGDEELQDKYIEEFVGHLWAHRHHQDRPNGR